MSNLQLQDLIKFLTKEEKDLTLENLFNIYYANAQATKAEPTAIFIRSHFGIINSFLDDINIKKASQVNSDAIIKFVNFCKLQELNNITINKRIGVLKAALNFAVKNGYIDKNNIEKFEKLKETTKPITIIDTNTISLILEYFEKTRMTKQLLRNKAIVYVLIDTGIRLNELINLKIDNLNLRDNIITLEVTKTKKIRPVFINNITKRVLLEHMNASKIYSGYIFLNPRYRTKMSRYNIDKIFRTIKKELNISSDINPHKWRHTFATLSLENGADINSIKEILGHSKLTTTQKYLHVSKTHLQNQHRTYSPLNNIEKKA